MDKLLLFILSSFFSVSLFALDVSITTPNAILMNADTGAVLFEKRAHDPVYPASTTKIVTALYILKTSEEHLNDICVSSLESLKHVSQEVKHKQNLPSYTLENDGSSINLKYREMISLTDLLKGALICSGNDACNVLAEHVSGNISTFVAEMNEMATSLGCISTHFTNPHGLFDENHITSAYDMAILTREALKYPLFREIVKSTSFNRPKTNLQEASTQRQSNQLLHPDSKYYYPKAIGIKTGYTKAAKYNLIAAATDGERTLIAALHQNPNSLARYEDARHLFEAAFSEKKVHRLLFKQDETVFNKAIPHAKSELKARIAEDIFIDFYPSEEIHPRAELEWLTPNLPITKDSVVGNLSIRNERNEEILKVALHAEAAVTKQWRYHMTEDLIPSLWKSPLPSLTTLPFLVFLVYKKRKKKL